MITRRALSPMGYTDNGIRCGRCNKYLAEMATRPWRILCPRCRHTNAGRVVAEVAPNVTAGTVADEDANPGREPVADAKTPQIEKTAAVQIRSRRRRRSLSAGAQ